METKKLLQEKFLELQMIDDQIKEIQQHLENFETQIAEIVMVKDSLNQIKKATKGSRILVPISNGIFINATLEEVNELAVNVGSNIVVKKSVEDTSELLNRQSLELSSLRQQIIQQLESLTLRAKEIEIEVQSLYEKSEK